MKTKRIIQLTFILLLSFTIGRAQSYKTGLGVKLGASQGLSVKHFIGAKSALEGILATRWRGFQLTGLYEMHANAFNTNRLNWYYGAGGHVGSWSGYDKHPWFEDDKSYTVIGVDGVLGLEYVIGEIPFSLSLDWKPAFNIVGYQGAWLGEGGLAIRYVW